MSSLIIMVPYPLKYQYGRLNMEYESTAEIMSLSLTEISRSWRTSVIGVVEVQPKIILGKLFLLPLPSCRQRMMSFALLVFFVDKFWSELVGQTTSSSAYSSITITKPISLKLILFLLLPPQ